MDGTFTQEFLDFAARVRANPELTRHATAARDHLFEAVGDYDATVGLAESAFGDEAHLLRGLMIFESIRRIREKHAARGVPADITRAELESQPYGVLRWNVKERGNAGAGDWIWSWYRTVGSGNLYRLGRLEFIPELWDYPYRVFRNVHTGDTVAMLNADQPFDDEGYNVGETTWVTTLQDLDDAIIGYPISPRGYAIRTPIRLSRQDWQQVLGPADTVLDMHIPGGIPMTFESVRDALFRTVSFFDQYYPDTPVTAFVCDSWIFSNQLEDMLPADSNILRFQREGYLFPDGVGQGDFLNFTFGSSTIDLATAPRDTGLRRAVINHLEKGGTMRCGGFLFLRRDLPRFGSQPYRNFDPLSELRA